MGSQDLFFLIATLSIIFITAFLCSALYWLILNLRLWYKVSNEAEQSLRQCIDRFHEALHAFTSMRAIADIGMQTLQAALSVYQNKTRKKKTRGSDESA